MQHMAERIFGHVPGYPEGSTFDSRVDLSDAGVHRPRIAGISGSERDGADSIVLSGGYEDDRDFGREIVYTGHGGRDPRTGAQVADQALRGGNLALAKSSLEGLPVRVVRGSRHASPYSPEIGYRYDGLYAVDDYWHAPGRSGFRIWRFRLFKISDDHAAKRVEEERSTYSTTQRRETNVLRVVRNSRQAREIKALYDHRCQVCGIRLEGPAGPYAEAAHIRPLGAPHDGPDTPDNILCLCPNHHVLFDHSGLIINEDLSLIGACGRLDVHPRHFINSEYLRYRRERYRTPGGVQPTAPTTK